jgi:hypothetical protein
MRESSLAELRRLASANENTLLFHARDSRDYRNSANLNVTAASGVTRETFGEAGPRDVEAIVAPLCNGFSEQAAAAGGEGMCLRHEVRSVALRRAIVIDQTATIPTANLDNRRTVVLIPSSQVLFTLGISLHRDAYDTELVDAILASIELPDGF